GIDGDFLARRGHAQRIGKRQIPLVSQRLGWRDLDLAWPRILMEMQRGLAQRLPLLGHVLGHRVPLLRMLLGCLVTLNRSLWKAAVRRKCSLSGGIRRRRARRSRA